MRVIYPDNIATISADEVNINFPISNVQNDHVKKVWKANSNDAVINIGVSSGSAVALFGSNATAVVVKTRIGGLGGQWDAAAQWHDGIGDVGADGAWNVESLTTETIKFDTLSTGQSALWCDYTDPGVGHTIEITLSSATGTTLEVGVIRAGTVRDFRDSEYGIREGFVDYSIQEELASGSWYYKKRDIVRTFGLILLEDRASDFYTFMHEVALLRGQQPLAWRLSENITDWQWIVYATFDGLPIGNHAYVNSSLIEINLKEVV
ncbi:MAG TPA: hypothetical protein ENH60_11685 [Pricia sp.]|nr:hypothetical protein [Pricia sp.]